MNVINLQRSCGALAPRTGIAVGREDTLSRVHRPSLRHVPAEALFKATPIHARWYMLALDARGEALTQRLVRLLAAPCAVGLECAVACAGIRDVRQRVLAIRISGDMETGVLELPRDAFQRGLASRRLGFA